MKLGIVLTTFNRPDYLKKCLDSLKAAIVPEGTLLIIVDDASTDQQTIKLIREFRLKNADVIIHHNERNSSVSHSLKVGYNKCFSYGCDAVTNLDSDAIMRPDFINVLKDLHEQFPQQIVSGFHSVNRNKDGSERHPVIKQTEKWVSKKSIGGINMMMNHATFKKFMEPALDKVLSSKAYNWDALTCINCMEYDLPPVVSVPSVVQHIGFDSSMHHKEEPDVAFDFHEISIKPLQLKNVSLIAIEGVDLNKIKIPLEASTKYIDYGAVKVLSHQIAHGLPVTKVKQMNSKKEYSRFILTELNNFVDTDFVLLIQHDGYVLNHESWTDEFLQYDYIGAPWQWYGDDCKVGNGGFSLRSKKMLDACADSFSIMMEYHPEDHAIGRVYRKYLEKHYDIKFAPDSLAEKFSIEAYNVKAPANKYNGSFGYHGMSVDFRNATLEFSPSKKVSTHTSRTVRR